MEQEKGFFAKMAERISSELEYNRHTAAELGVGRLDLFLYGTKGAVKRKWQNQIGEVLDALEDCLVVGDVCRSAIHSVFFVMGTLIDI